MQARPSLRLPRSAVRENNVFYAVKYSGYGDQFLMDQLRATPNSRLVVLQWKAPSPPPADVRTIAGFPYFLRAIDYRAARLFFNDRRPIRHQQIDRHFRRATAVFTLFAQHAVDVLPYIRSSTRLVMHCAGNDIMPDLDDEYLSRLQQAFERADLVTCGSEFLRQRALALGAPEPRTVVHYLGVEVPDEYVEPHDKGGDFTAITVSRLHPLKGVEWSVRSFDLATRDLPESRLVIVGDGAERKRVEETATKLGIASRVEFTGQLSREAVFRRMLGADVMLQHNIPLEDGSNEAIGGSILEASARALPIIATDTGGVGEAVIAGQTGLLSEPRDVQGMAANIRRLLDSTELRRNLGTAGRRYVSEHQNAETRRTELADLIRGTGPSP